MYDSIPDKIKQEFISKVVNVYIFYHIDLIYMLDFKNPIWCLICTMTFSYGMTIMDLTVNISQ